VARKTQIVSITTLAEELTAAYLNGNRKSVRDDLRKMPKAIGIAVALRVRDALSDPNDPYRERSFVRIMTDDL